MYKLALMLWLFHWSGCSDSSIMAAATNPALLDSAAKLRINVVTTYGSSETSGGCVYNGRPIAGARVKIVDGRIHLGGPMVARGYRNVDSLPLADDLKDGWFRTSDAGLLIDGRLTVLGRTDHIIDSGGLKLHPEVLETLLLRIEGVTAACVVGVPDERLGERIDALARQAVDDARLTGVLAQERAQLRLPAAELGRPVLALFNEERVVGRAWPLAENRITVAELTW